MNTSNTWFTSYIVHDMNDLKRLSINPGHLNYEAYSRYLIINGHTRAHAGGKKGSITPNNSALQANHGDRGDDMTDYRADQTLWSQDNLPDILYIFQRPEDYLDRLHLKDVPMKQYQIYGKILRDIPILPDHIASDVEGWRVEAWIRHDPRVALSDIMDRIDPDCRPKNKSVVQMRAFRFRKDCLLLGWAGGRKMEDLRRQLIKEMIMRGVDPKDNTTRGMSWGLKVKERGERGVRIGVPVNRRVPNTAASNVLNVFGNVVANNFAGPVVTQPLALNGAAAPTLTVESDELSDTEASSSVCADTDFDTEGSAQDSDEWADDPGYEQNYYVDAGELILQQQLAQDSDDGVYNHQQSRQDLSQYSKVGQTYDNHGAGILNEYFNNQTRYGLGLGANDHAIASFQDSPPGYLDYVPNYNISTQGVDLNGYSAGHDQTAPAHEMNNSSTFNNQPFLQDVGSFQQAIPADFTIDSSTIIPEYAPHPMDDNDLSSPDLTSNDIKQLLMATYHNMPTLSPSPENYNFLPPTQPKTTPPTMLTPSSPPPPPNPTRHHHPAQPTPEPPSTLLYHNHPLTLIPPSLRQSQHAQYTALTALYLPYLSRGRRLQLRYLLSPTKLSLRNGFVDMRGHHPPTVTSTLVPVDDDTLRLLAWACEPFDPAHDDTEDVDALLLVVAARAVGSAPLEYACIEADIVYR